MYFELFNFPLAEVIKFIQLEYCDYFNMHSFHLKSNWKWPNLAHRPACPSSLYHTWETLLQEVEIDSQALSEIASILGRQVSRPLLEKSFYRKIQSRKVFTHRDSYDTIIAKTEEKLAKVSGDVLIFKWRRWHANPPLTNVIYVTSFGCAITML